MKNILLILFLFLISFQAISQKYFISGTVKSENDGSTFPGATVALIHPEDSTVIKGTVTDLDGNFQVKEVVPGIYLLKVRYIGLRPWLKNIELEGRDIHLGDLFLEEETTTLKEVTITARRSLGEQKGDTTQFNASAFKTLNDASAQNLVEKMPGIGMVDGSIQAQGENVVRILVDGKPFFGTDVKAALQSLPAEIIESIEVFDKKSDKAELSGFDDGEREKTINIVTKPDRRKGQFGKSSLGYGSGERYLLGTSLNHFNEDQRVTITGLSNNINAMDYSGDPNSQGESRTQDGIITTNTLGINFNDNWSDKIAFSASYLFSQRDNIETTSRVRNYVLSSDEGQEYKEDSYETNKDLEHELDLRFDYQINDKTRLLIRPEASFKKDRNNTVFSGRTDTPSGPLNQIENSLQSTNTDFEFENDIYFSRQFDKAGRSLTLGLETENNLNDDNANRESENIYFMEEDRLEMIRQNTTRFRKGFSWEADVSFTEPIGKYGQMELEYEISNQINDSDKLTFDTRNEEGYPGQVFSILDTALSNTFDSEYLEQETEIGYQYKRENFKVQVEAEYQNAYLKNNQVFPSTYQLERRFQGILPTVRIDYDISASKNLEFDYDTNTDAPSIGDLQDVIDNTNPIHLRTGNQNLEQSYSNRLRLRYRSTNQDTDHSFFAYVQTSLEKNRVSNSTLIAEEAMEIGEGIVLERGSQLSRPVNLDGYWELRSYFSYGMPLDFLKSNFNLNGGIDHSHRPGMINQEINFVNSSRVRGGFSLGSNISDRVDFNIYSRSTYNLVDNSLQPDLDNNFFNQSTRVNLNMIFWKGFVYRMDLNHQINTGLSAGYDNSFLLVNMSLGKKIFKNQRGEISLNIYDLLGQNNNIRRNITETYVEDIQSNVLQRYVLLSFTYNLRNFGKGTDMDDYDELHN
ncbi:MAG: outer membrane beta-barrel protein [Cyclobacteriaceae bacterium]